MKCHLCQKAEPHPNRKCAFSSGQFSSDNWGCETMISLRAAVYNWSDPVWSEDQYAGLVPIEIHRDEHTYHHLLLGWYKRRGKTELCRILDGDGNVSTPTYIEIAELIDSLQ